MKKPGWSILTGPLGWLWAPLLVVLFAIHVRFIELLTRKSITSLALLPDKKYPHFVASLPIPVAFAGSASHQDLFWIFLTIGLQTLCLYLVYRTICDGPPRLSVTLSVAVAALGMAIVALQAKFTSADVYVYVGYAKLGLDAYSPSARPFDGDFSIINTQWGNPIVPCVYGPLWIVINKVAVAWTTTLGHALLAMRFLNIVVLGVLVLSVASMHRDRAVLALLSINPAVYYSYIIMARNDLLAITFVIAAMALVVRRPLAGLALVVGGGLVKISMIYIGLVAFAHNQALKKRLPMIILAPALILLFSRVWGGRSYFIDMMLVAHRSAARHPAFHLYTTLVWCMIVVEIVAYAIGIGFGRFFRSATWVFCATPVGASSTYLAWCTPYALKARSYTIAFLILWTVVLNTLGSYVYGNPWRLQELALVCVVVYIVVDIYNVWKCKYAPDSLADEAAQ